MSSGDDAIVLRSIGHDIIQSFVAVTVETFVIAIYSVLVFFTGCLLLRKRRTTVSSWTCAAVFVMFGLALALWMIDIHNVILEVQMTLLSTSTDPLGDVYFEAVSKVLRLASVEDVLYAYMTIIGDSIIIWRVCAFWSRGRERLILIVPILFLLGSLACSLMLTYCSARLGADIKLGTYQNPAFCRNIQTASYSTTLATTGVATILIAYKAWEYRRTHLAAFGLLSRRTRAQKIMLMLVESGVLYMLFFLVQVIMSLASVNAKINKNATLTFALTIYEFISSLIVGIYPTIVVILVSSKHSVFGTDRAAQGVVVFTSVQESTYTDASSSVGSAHTRVHAKAKPVTLTYEMANLPVGRNERAWEAKDRDPVVAA